MGILRKTKKTPAKPPKFEKNPNLKKLSMFVTIVPHGHAQNIIHIFERFEVAAQFVQRGSGTASKDILGILGIEDTGKDIIISLVKEENIPDIKPELEAYFIANKANRGIGMVIPMKSIVGVTVYKFLTNTI